MSEPLVVEVRSRAGASLGIASLVLGALAFAVCWIPLVGAIGMPLSALGLLLGLVALLLTTLRRSQGLGFALAGSLTCIVALGVAYAISRAAVAALDEVAIGLGASNSTRVATTSSGVPESSKNGSAMDREEPAPVFQPSDQPAVHGDVRVGIESARVGIVEISELGETKKSKEPYLVITARVTNLSQGKKLTYLSWGNRDNRFLDGPPKLRDDRGNDYSLISFGMLAFPVGRVISESLYPGKDLTDVLVFERPVDAAEHLDLELPAKYYDGEGMIRIRIAASTIR